MRYLQFLFCGAALSLLPFIFLQAQSWNVEQVGSLYNLWDCCRDVAVQEDYAYLANYASGLCAVDISESGTPRIVGNLDFDGIVDVISVDGDYACLRAIGFGFHLADISNPEQPVMLCSVPITYAQDVDLYDQYLYVTDCNDGLLIFDISDPTSPDRIGRFDLPQYTRHTAVSGDYAYVGTDSKGLVVIDISDPTEPTATGLVRIENGSFHDVEYKNGVVYALNSGTVHTIDVNVPSMPYETCQNNLGEPAMGLAISDQYLYVAGGSYGYHILDLSNPYVPSFFVTHSTPGYGNEVWAVDNMLYLADLSSFRIYQIDNPQSPIELGFVEENGYLRAAEKDGNLVYLGDYDNGLRIVDVSDATSPMEVSRCFNSFTEHCYNLAVADSFAYLACFDNGFAVVDVTDPSAPLVAHHNPYPSYMVGLDIVGNLAYLANRSEGLRILDLSDPYNPVEVGLYDTFNQATAVDVFGDYACVGEWGWMEIINIANPTQPFYISDISYHMGYIRQVRVRGDYAYLVGSDTYLKIVDISDPYQPQIIFEKEGDNGNGAWDIVLQGDYAIVATNFTGLQVLNIADPRRPSVAGYHQLTNESMGLAVEDSLAYLANLYEFEIFDCSEAMIPTDGFAGGGREPAFELEQIECDVNPNPFNPSAVISYQLSAVSHVTLAVFDISGKKVVDLVNSWREAGKHEVTFDASNMPSGVYIYTLKTNDLSTSGKMVLMK